MKTTVEFLDAVMKKNGISSDNQLAIFLGCTRSSISGYRHKKTFLDDPIACRIAEDLNLEPSYVLASIASERAKKPEVKAAWAHAAEVLYGLAAALAVIAILPLSSLPSGDFNIAFMGLAGASECILCQIV